MRAGSRSFAGLLAMMLVGFVSAGCDDDGPTEPRLTLAELSAEYQMTELTFDPQGSAPAADVLGARQADISTPMLNIDLVGSFTVQFREFDTGSNRTLGGDTRTTVDGIQLTFATQTMADEFLLPRTLPLTWDEQAGTLSFSGSATVNRARLLELFPDLYADEQFLDPTPGTLTIEFTRDGEEG